MAAAGAAPWSRDGVVSTARWIAAARASETSRPDAIFQDRFASALAGDEGQAFRGGAAPIAASRTRFFDDVALARAREGALQVVSLGVGMCTRAVRLPWPPGTRVFELDKQELFDLKEPILEPMLTAEERRLAERVVLPVDFRRGAVGWAEALDRHGFDRQTPTCWILEGLVYYLSPEENQATFEALAAMSASGSGVVFDMVNAKFMQQESGGWHLSDLSRRGCPWKWGHDDPASLLAPLGFDADVLDLSYLDVDRQGRRLVRRRQPAGICPHPATFYVTAIKR